MIDVWGGGADFITIVHKGIYLNICKILNNTYVKSCLEHVVANVVMMNSDDILKLMSLLNEFDNFFMEILENGTQSL